MLHQNFFKVSHKEYAVQYSLNRFSADAILLRYSNRLVVIIRLLSSLSETVDALNDDSKY